MTDSMYDAFTGTYGFDYEQAIRNAIACDNGDPQLSDWVSLDEADSLPKCLVNLEVWEQVKPGCGGQISCDPLQ